MRRKTACWLMIITVSLVLTACGSGDPQSRLASARALVKAGNTAQAIPELEAITAADPAQVEAHVLLAQAYGQAERNDDALTQYQSAIAMAKEASIVSYVLDPQDKLAFFLMGNAYVGAGQPVEAAKQYQAVLKLDPSHVGANTNLGAAYYQMGNLEGAIQQLQTTLQLAPDDAEAHYLLGAAFTQQKKLAEAEAEFRKALTAKPDMAEAYVGLGNVQVQNGDAAGAIASLQQAVTLNPVLPEAYLPLGKALADKGDKAGAREALNTFLKLNPPPEWRQEAEQLLAQLGQ